MRLTIYVDENLATPDTPFAVVWLDLDDNVWSRESHAGVALPSWGSLKRGTDAISLCPPDSSVPLCTLLGIESARASVERPSSGVATWMIPEPQAAPIAGRWHLQAVDLENEVAERSEFRS
jgi:Protein of unknown function (DUF3564)